MSIYPTVRPSLTLDFQKSKQLDPRISFSRSSSATYVEGGVVKYADEHQARFEAEGLLIEESRTNSQKWSSDFSQISSYSLINNGDGAVPVLDNTLYEAPDGSVTAQRWTLQITDTTDTGNQSGIQAGTSGIPAGAYVTVWAKSATGADQTVFLTSQGNDTFTVTSKWQRFDLGPRGTIPFRALARGTYTNAVVDILLWGVQMEAGAFCTSLIPTAGSTVTRAADVAQITGDNFSSWYNASESTFAVNYISEFESSQQAVVAISDGTNNNRISFRPRNSFGDSSGVRQFNVALLANATPPNVPDSIGLSVDSFGAYLVNKNASDSDITSVTMPVGVNKLEIGKVEQSLSFLNGHIARISYYSERLTNEQLEAITS